MNAPLRSLAAVFGISLAFAACGDDRDPFDDGGVFADPDAAPIDTGVCGFRCSPDLKKVLRGCAGAEQQVVAECGPDQGCGIDTCVDACESARLSKGSVGCSFWTVAPDDEIFGSGACYAALVANTWDRPVALGAEFKGAPLDISKSVYTATRSGPDAETYTRVDGPLMPGQVGVVFLAQAAVPVDPDAPRCPVDVVPALSVDPFTHGTAKSNAFHLKADAPIAAYAIFPYGGASSFYPASTLLLPVSSWDTSYIAVATGKFGDPNDRSRRNRRTVQIVADADDTRVSMRPSVDISAGRDVEGARRGEAKSWTLARGEVLQLVLQDTLAGSPISSTKPIGLFGGSPCTFLPIEHGACDLTQQQIAPFAQWGMSYQLVPFHTRIEGAGGSQVRETVAYSLVGAEDGTALTWDPAKPPAAPDTLSAGQVANFMSDAIVSVRSQDDRHPFYAAIHMTGYNFGGGEPGRGAFLGDPDFVNVVPSEQFLSRYVFFADYTYPDTTLTIVRKKTAAGFAPVELACAGEITTFAPLGRSGEFEYAWVSLTKGYKPQPSPKGDCGYGRHEARSDGPFSVTVWGMSPAASYGYTGGTGARPVNAAPPPSVQ